MPALSPSLLASLGAKRIDAGAHRAADLWLRRLIFQVPDWDVPWFDLGLLYKRQGRWLASQRCNARAVALNANNEGAWWNLGIAATARGDWAEARRAWRSYGIEMPDGDGPPDVGYGMTPVRLDPERRAEVVWAYRLDPARARIENVPYPASGHRYHDVVLHDGYLAGERVASGRTYPVFNALELLVPSPYKTFHATVECALTDDLGDLDNLAEANDVRVQNWTTSTRNLDREVSEGSAPEFLDEVATGEASLGIAARSEAQANAFLRAWVRAKSLRSITDMHLGLGTTAAEA